MNDLRPRTWQDFQQICRYWMQHLVETNGCGAHTYQVFGNDGQCQGGVDLIPGDPNLGIVGQSKRWYTKILTWAEIQKELLKTEQYPGLIRSYVILTTAPRHASVQLAMPNDRCMHIRESGLGFSVFIYYWENLKNLDFIPREELPLFFPNAYEQFATAQQPQLQPSDYTKSLMYAREYLPKLVSSEHLAWLSSWNFNLGFVPAKYFDLFAEISIELNRTQLAMKHEILQSWLNEGDRVHLGQCYPAASPLFDAIGRFAQSVTGETVSGNLPDGSLCYGHYHDDPSASARIAHAWKRNADALVAAYKAVIGGEPQWD